MLTLAPSEANATAIASPIPDAPPVTMAVLPAKKPSAICLYLSLGPV